VKQKTDSLKNEPSFEPDVLKNSYNNRFYIGFFQQQVIQPIPIIYPPKSIEITAKIR
jgi:hypothetical protein